MFDSSSTVADNPSLSFDPASFAGWYSAITSSDPGPLGRPVSMLSFALDAQTSDPGDSRRFNRTNLAIHLLNGLLFLGMVLLLQRNAPVLQALAPGRSSRWIALIAAALFLLHPLHVSTVLYAVQRMTLLAATAVLAGVCAFVVERGRLCREGWNPAIGGRAIGAVVLFTVIGALCKESGILLPWLVITVEIYLFRWRMGDRTSPVLRAATLLVLALPLIAFLMLLTLAPEFFANWYSARDFTMAERVMTQLRVTWTYLGWFLAPDLGSLGFFHDDIVNSRHLLEPSSTAIALLGWCGVAGLLLLALRRESLALPAFAFAWFVVGHLLESTVIPLEMVFEHRNYVPLIGFAIVTPYALAALRQRLGAFVVCGGATGALLLFAWLLFLRASYWGDALLLTSSNVERHPASARSVYHYANELLDRADVSNDPVTARRYAIEARTQYERLAGMPSSGLVGAVTLLYIDGRYFERMEHDRWIQAILEAVRRTGFSAADNNAVGLLADCAIAGYCTLHESEFEHIVQTALVSQGQNPDVTFHWARYVAGALSDWSRARELARTIYRRNPDYLPAYHLAIAASVNMGQRGDALDIVADLYAADGSFTQIYSLLSYLN
jgi:hypothetical protein